MEEGEGEQSYDIQHGKIQELGGQLPGKTRKSEVEVRRGGKKK